jgi:hypothetical protein
MRYQISSDTQYSPYQGNPILSGSFSRKTDTTLARFAGVIYNLFTTSVGSNQRQISGSGGSESGQITTTSWADCCGYIDWNESIIVAICRADPPGKMIITWFHSITSKLLQHDPGIFQAGILSKTLAANS